ncbi:hypothetical protein GO286_04856 [Ralstonia solanacearum]|nr:hypothetical protein [Ralstonia solanacearum]
MTLVCTYPLCNSTEAYWKIRKAIHELAPGAALEPTNKFCEVSGQWITTICGLSEDEELAIQLRLDGQCISAEWPKDL